MESGSSAPVPGCGGDLGWEGQIQKKGNSNPTTSHRPASILWKFFICYFIVYNLSCFKNTVFI